MPFQLGYVSAATRPMHRDDLIELLREARELNARDGVTGLLLYQDGHFLQVLEGAEATVRDTFERIAHDGRHKDIQILFEDETDEAHYPDWSMGFQALDGSEWLEFPEVDDAPKSLRAMAEDLGRAKGLLMFLRQRGLDPGKELSGIG
jgi:hypothetical protein